LLRLLLRGVNVDSGETDIEIEFAPNLDPGRASLNLLSLVVATSTMAGSTPRRANLDLIERALLRRR
jgi:hypothetical protein